jgi:hypothetical protein
MFRGLSLLHIRDVLSPFCFWPYYGPGTIIFIWFRWGAIEVCSPLKSSSFWLFRFPNIIGEQHILRIRHCMNVLSSNSLSMRVYSFLYSPYTLFLWVSTSSLNIFNDSILKKYNVTKSKFVNKAQNIQHKPVPSTKYKTQNRMHKSTKCKPLKLSAQQNENVTHNKFFCIFYEIIYYLWRITVEWLVLTSCLYSIIHLF